VLATLPVDTLTTLAANQSDADLVWFANYLASMGGYAEGDAAETVAQVASGTTTIELLRNPPVATSNEAAAPAPAGSISGQSAEPSGTAANQPPSPWSSILGSGVLAASVILFFCIVVVGVILAGRDQGSEAG
jgi:hypothetical protein